MAIRRRRLWIEQARGRADADREAEGEERRTHGSRHREFARRAWRVAHEIARALNVTPWEALLGEVRRTAGEVAWLDRKVAQAPSDAALLSRREPDPEGDTEAERLGGWAGWVKLRNDQRRHLAYVSKLAIDAGVAQQLVSHFTLQGETVARLVLSVTGNLGLTSEQEGRVPELLRVALLQLESTASGDRALEGEIVEVRRDRE